MPCLPLGNGICELKIIISLLMLHFLSHYYAHMPNSWHMDDTLTMVVYYMCREVHSSWLDQHTLAWRTVRFSFGPSCCIHPPQPPASILTQGVFLVGEKNCVPPKYGIPKMVIRVFLILCRSVRIPKKNDDVIIQNRPNFMRMMSDA